jgi:L-amino acid N-acyltransferase YncA
MRVRLALPGDEDVIVAMARTNMEQTRPTLTFDEARCRATVRRYLDHADPTIFVAEKDGEVIGMLVANFYEYLAASGLFVTQEVLFVQPDKRGTRAAALLMKQLISWAEELGAVEIVGGNDNEFQSERTARFLEHFGFKRVGITMRRAMV